jgi:hypothetical protein
MFFLLVGIAPTNFHVADSEKQKALNSYSSPDASLTSIRAAIGDYGFMQSEARPVE